MEIYDFPKISGPANRALVNAGFTSIEQLTEVSEKDLLGLHGIKKRVNL